MKYIYFITDDCGEYKIGYSKNTYQRLKTLQTARSKQLRIAAQIPTDFGRKTECALHRALAKFNIGGEWFAFTNDDLEFAKDACIKIENIYKSLKKNNNPFI